MNKSSYITSFLLLLISAYWTFSITQEVILTLEEPIRQMHINPSDQLHLLSGNTLCVFKDRQEFGECFTSKDEPDFYQPMGRDTFALMGQNWVHIVHKSEVLFKDTFPDIITATLKYGDEIIVATGKGLFSLDSRRNIREMSALKNEYVNDMDTNGHDLVVALDYGVGKIDLRTREISILRMDQIVNQITILENGTTFALTAEDSIVQINNGLEIENKGSIVIGEIRDLTSSLNQTFVISSEGCYEIMTSMMVNKILKGSFSHVLACTNTLLLSQGKDLVRLNITSKEVVSEQAVFSLYAENNSLWVGSKGKILKFINDSIYQAIPIPSGMEQLFVSAILTDELNIYAGTMGAGIFIFDKKGHFKKQIYNPGQPNKNNIIQIKELNGDVWIAYLNGIYRLESTSLEITRDYKNLLEKNYLYCFEPIGDEEFYVGTSSRGVLRYQNGNLTSYLDGKSVYSLFNKKEGGVIAGTEKEGAFLIKGTDTRIIDDLPGIISSFAFPDMVILTTRNQVLMYPSGSKNTLSFPINSLINSQLNAISSTENLIYVGFENGFLKIHRDRLLKMFENKVQLNEPLLFNLPVNNEHSSFKFDENSFSFNYQNQYYNLITPIQFKYRLLGLDTNWQLTQQNTINYYNLIPGQYAFQVAGGYSASFKPVAVQSYHFTIDNPFWRKTGFIVGLIILALGITLLLIRRREKMVVGREKRAQEKIKFELEQLKNQIDPHFLFNSLNSLVGLLEENPGSASAGLQDLSDVYRSILQYEKMDLISIQEDIELGKKYFEIHKIRFEKLIDLNICDTSCPGGKLLPMTTQLLIENAIKHNIINRDHPLSIEIQVEEKFIMVTNRYQPKNNKTATSGGMGLDNLKARYRYYTHIPVEITQGPTLFSVKIPVVYE